MGNQYYSGPVSDHFDGTRFFNPGHAATDRSLADILRWKLGARPTAWPSVVSITPTVPQPRSQELCLSMVGHATVLIQAGGLNVVTDPVWSLRASPLRFAGPKRVTPPGIAFDRLPAIDVVLLSHNHYDHLDIATLRRLHARDRPLIVTPLGNDTIVRAAIPDARVTVGDWDDAIDLPGGGKATIVPAHHWSSRSLSDRRMALWGGFILQLAGRSIYFAGDTGYGDGGIFRQMRQRYGAPDVALLPIGAYAPRWFMAAQHTNPDEAVRILLDLEARRAIGIHWGSFQLTDEGREAPLAELADALTMHAIASGRFVPASPGDVFTDFPA